MVSSSESYPFENVFSDVWEFFVVDPHNYDENNKIKGSDLILRGSVYSRQDREESSYIYATIYTRWIDSVCRSIYHLIFYSDDIILISCQISIPFEFARYSDIGLYMLVYTYTNNTDLTYYKKYVGVSRLGGSDPKNKKDQDKNIGSKSNSIFQKKYTY